jgi:hypothetical protein
MHLKQSYANIQHKGYEFRGADTVQIPSYLLIIGRLLSGRSLHSVYSSALQLIHSTTPIALNETPKNYITFDLATKLTERCGVVITNPTPCLWVPGSKLRSEPGCIDEYFCNFPQSF